MSYTRNTLPKLEYEVPSYIGRGKNGSRQEKPACCIKKASQSKLEAGGGAALGTSATITDTAEPASLSFADPGCAGRSHTHAVYFFFAQFSWLELFGEPTTILDFLPGKWKNSLT